MSQSSTTERAADAAHDIVSQAEVRIGELEAQVRALLAERGEHALEAGEELRERALLASEEARELASETLRDMESYIREKPLQAAGMAFAAGLLAALVLRR